MTIFCSVNPGMLAKTTSPRAHIPLLGEKATPETTTMGLGLYKVSQIIDKSQSVQPPFVGGGKGGEEVRPTHCSCPNILNCQNKREKIHNFLPRKVTESTCSKCALWHSKGGWGWEERGDRWDPSPEQNHSHPLFIMCFWGKKVFKELVPLRKL